MNDKHLIQGKILFKKPLMENKYKKKIITENQVKNN